MKCQKIIYKNLGQQTRNNVLLGIIVHEDDNFIHFRTDKRKYTISKSLVLSIIDTDVEFRGYKK
ncbi:hypothetical protein HN918_01620 [archaeon]|jgi:hypothetical protein|nr:hypothetical protein [archaeon]